ncbi:MAG: hypothetical protein LBK71_08210 [Verrucomicrobiales bacterium]|jgi:hypothetical protein|nr:hypothetical protein [Verrucomicrobiales bacterium]
MNSNIIKSLLAAAAFGALTLGGASNNARASYAPAGGNDFVSSTVALNINFEGGFNVVSGTAYLWSPYPGTTAPTGTGGYNTAYLTSATSAVTTVVWSGSLNGNGYGDPFGIYVPIGIINGGTFFAATYNSTVGGLFAYDDTTGTFSNSGTAPIAVFDSLYAADYDHGGRLYLSGLNSAWTGTYGQNNIIAIYPGSGTFQPIIQAVGNSAGVAVDDVGNVYYADSVTSGTAYLRMWTKDQVSTAVGFTGSATLNDANSTTLIALPAGASGNGITVDSGTNVFVSYNTGSTGGIFVWSATAPLNRLDVATLTPTTGG